MTAFEAVAVMMVLVAVGVLVQRLGWVTEPVLGFVAKAVVNVALPAYMVWNFLNPASGYDRAKMLEILPLVPIPFLSICALLALGFLLARLVVGRDRRGVFSSMVGFSNTIFIGLPINMLLFGDSGIPYVMVTYIANTVLYWTAGFSLIRADGERISGQTGSRVRGWPWLWNSVRTLFSPPIIAFLVSLILIFLDIKAPRFLVESAHYIGGLTTPLSMMFIGFSLAQTRFRELRLDRSSLLVAAGRFLLAPAVMLGIATAAQAIFRFTLPKLALSVFIIQACMPVMAQTAIMAKKHGADDQFAAQMTVFTTLLSMGLIPLVFGLLHWL